MIKTVIDVMVRFFRWIYYGPAPAVDYTTGCGRCQTCGYAGPRCYCDLDKTVGYSSPAQTTWYGVAQDTCDRWTLLDKEALREIALSACSIFKESHFSAVAMAMVNEIRELAECLLDVEKVMKFEQQARGEDFVWSSPQLMRLLDKYREKS